MNTGPATGFILPLPAGAWHTLDVELDVVGGTSVRCLADGLVGFSVSLPSEKYPKQRLLYDQHVMLQRANAPNPAKSATLRFAFTKDRLSATWAKEPLIDGPNPKGEAFAGTINFAFRGDVVVRRLRISGTPDKTVPPPNPVLNTADPLRLEVAIDFADDLIRASFDEAMFDRLFAELASWGTRRVQWIYTGPPSDGFFDHYPLGIAEHFDETVNNVGDPFAAAVNAAHRHGIEVFAVFKPFDMGLRWSYGEGTAEARKHGRLDRIGGPVGFLTHFAAEHRELMMARKPGTFGNARFPTWTRIDVVKQDENVAAFSINDLRLYVSEDNAQWRPYTGRLTRSEAVESYPLRAPTPSGPQPDGQVRRARVFRLDGLQLTEKYVAVAVACREGSFGNRLCDLIRVYGDGGEEDRLTYAATARYVELGNKTADYPWDVGFEFDRFPGSPTANFAGGYDAVGEPFVLDSGIGVLALARGKARDTLAAMSPSFPETRKHWLAWLQAALDAGADGIELRLGNHNADFAWGEYGFEEPVRDEFLRLHGVDIWQTDEFDREAWRRLRGSDYTQFVLEASELARTRSKRFGIHIEPWINTDPAIGGAMNIHWDWQTWLRETRPDTISLKGMWPQSAFANTVMPQARQLDTAVTYVPYAVNWFSDYWSRERKPGGAKLIEQLIGVARENKLDAFQLYECAAVVAARPGGRIEMLEPRLKNVFRAAFIPE